VNYSANASNGRLLRISITASSGAAYRHRPGAAACSERQQGKRAALIATPAIVLAEVKPRGPGAWDPGLGGHGRRRNEGAPLSRGDSHLYFIGWKKKKGLPVGCREVARMLVREKIKKASTE